MKSLLLLSFIAFNVYAHVPGTGEPEMKWDQREIRVCWANSDYAAYENDFSRAQRTDAINPIKPSFIKITDEQKSRVQNLMEQEFTQERTGIAFTGWDNCRNVTDYDVVIFTGDSSKANIKAPVGRASIGRCGDLNNFTRLNDHQKSFVFLNYKSINGLKTAHNDSLLRTALHEFGHLSGLRHEHIRSDAKADPSCSDLSENEQPFASTEFFSVYDPSSIMNYCLLDLIDLKTGDKFTSQTPGAPKASELSQYKDRSILKITRDTELTSYEFKLKLSRGDVHSLKCLYVHDNKTRKEICHKSYQP